MCIDWWQWHFHRLEVTLCCWHNFRIQLLTYFVLHVCVRACVHACVRGCVCMCVRVCVCATTFKWCRLPTGCKHHALGTGRLTGCSSQKRMHHSPVKFDLVQSACDLSRCLSVSLCVSISPSPSLLTPPPLSGVTLSMRTRAWGTYWIAQQQISLMEEDFEEWTAHSTRFDNIQETPPTHTHTHVQTRLRIMLTWPCDNAQPLIKPYCAYWRQ